jgi:hypothetical protein
MSAERSEVARLEDELAVTARKIARLLVHPRYDEAELAELEVRAGELRSRIRQAQPPVAEFELALRLPSSGNGLVSGG